MTEGGLAIQLEGHVYLIDLDEDGKETSRTQLSDEIVCMIITNTIERAVEVSSEQYEKEETQAEEAKQAG